MKIWTSEHVFNHSWDTVVTAAWRKYPNPHNTAVIGTDVIDRSIDAQGRLKSHRLLSTTWGLPTIVTRIIGMQETCFGSEHSIVDPKEKCFTMKSRNITYANVVSLDEKLVYSPHPDDPNKTLVKQEATVTVSGLPLRSSLEQMITDGMTENAKKGRQAMEWVIDTLKKEAVELSREAQKCMDNVMTNSL